jgi:hypothetical protein
VVLLQASKSGDTCVSPVVSRITASAQTQIRLCPNLYAMWRRGREEPVISERNNEILR